MSFRVMGIDGMDIRQQPDVVAPPLTRESSIYSLTFGEFQSTVGGMGKDFGSMNMEEFLKNIWTAEESQAMAAALGVPDGVDCGAQAGLERQGSLTLPRTLSQKTVDEVWRDLTRESAGGAGGSEFHHKQQQRQQQPTLGEMTLEEFLVRAGVVREEMNPSFSRPVFNSTGVPVGSSADITGSVFYGDSLASGNNNTGLALGFPQVGRNNVGIMSNSIPGNSGANLSMSAAGTMGQLPLGSNVELGSPQRVRDGGLIGIGDPAICNGFIPGMGGGGVNVGASVAPVNQIPSDGLTKRNEDLSSLSPVPYVFNGSSRGRNCGGAVEKVVERRQRRMIKNRESAARSRARKQAYTMELEAEVAKLKEQNQELEKKQAEMKERQKNQVLDMMLNQQRETKKLCLRRTQTGPW